jgi:biopolymer transport protein ExbD
MAGERTTRRGGIADHKYMRPADGKPKAASSRASLTPMIDVTFLLLLFFLLTFTFRRAEGGLPGSLPQLGEYPPPPVVMTTVVISSAGSDRTEAVFEIDGSLTPLTSGEQLYLALVRRRSLLGDAAEKAMIMPSGDVRWQHVVEAHNQLLRAKFPAIGFAQSR